MSYNLVSSGSGGAFVTQGDFRMRNTARIAVAAAFCFTAAYAIAQQGTKQQQAACKPDVYRLCKEFMPDSGKIYSCLQQNMRKLRPACRKVIS